MSSSEPKDKTSYAYFEWLKKENARQLRRAGHKAPASNERVSHRRTSFNKPDDSKIRSIDSDITYEKWCLAHDIIQEPLEANPDLFEEISPEESF